MFLHVQGRGWVEVTREWKSGDWGIIILASWEKHFIRVCKNLLQYPHTTAVMTGTCMSKSKEGILWPINRQKPITIHIENFQTKVMQSKGLIVYSLAN